MVLKLNASEIKLLERLARRSKMDCWFGVDENNNIYDRENPKRSCSASKLCRTLLDGLTPFDIENLDKYEVFILLGIALKL